jgi:PII-like signaling protein
MKTAVQVTMYLTESDNWDQVLQALRRENVAGAGAFHAVAGFLGRNRVRTASLVEAGGNLPVVIIFVDYEEHISRVLPKLFEMVPHRLIVRENVSIEQDALG